MAIPTLYELSKAFFEKCRLMSRLLFWKGFFDNKIILHPDFVNGSGYGDVRIIRWYPGKSHCDRPMLRFGVRKD